MNWGNRIVVAFVFFVCFILYMVVQAFNQHSDLVAEDYYAQEINYQEKLEQKANLENLDKKILIKQEEQSVVIQFPEGQKPEGEIHFYHPSRKSFDKKFAIEIDTENNQMINKDQLITGNYRVNITWESDGESYFQQEKIFIQ